MSNTEQDRTYLRAMIKRVVLEVHSRGVPCDIIREELERAAKNILTEKQARVLRGAVEKPARREDWHYDSQGYCDNPGRGY